MIVDRNGNLVQRLQAQCPAPLHAQMFKILLILSSAKTMIDAIRAGLTFQSVIRLNYTVYLGSHMNVNHTLQFECVRDVIDGDKMRVV